MTIATDILYIEKIGHQFKRFSKTSSGTYRLRCPYCGDSTHSQYSTASIFTKAKDGDSMYFFCHRGCGSKTLGQFIKDNSPSDYAEYTKESFSDPFDRRNDNIREKNKKTNLISISVFSELMQPLSSIKEGDTLYYIKEEAIRRKIPTKLFGEIFATNHLYDVMNIIPKYNNKDITALRYEPAIVFPYYIDMEKNMVNGLIFRKIVKTSIPKYIAVSLEDESPYYYSKFVNKSKPIIATEGVFDKWMVNNSIMMSGVNKWKSLPKELGLQPKQIILVFDNDFITNVNVKEQMIEAAKVGFKIFIHPELKSQTIGKDLNDYTINTGIDAETLTNLVINNSYSGLRAIFHINSI